MSVYLSYVVFVIICIYSFFRFKVSRAITTMAVWGWMFLPQRHFSYAGFPDQSKASFVILIPLAFSFIIYLGKFTKFKFSILDIPMILWIFTAPLTSLVNGYSYYDAISAVLGRLSYYAAPYFLARLFLIGVDDRKELMKQLFIAAVVYVPLCWFEMRFSPQLHRWVYGYHPHEFIQSVRSVGYRPVVFMKHGLQVALFLLTSAIIGLTYLRYKIYFFKNGISYSSFFTFAVVVTVYATQSYYAFIKLSFYLALSLLPQFVESRAFYSLFTAFHFFYVFFRANLLYMGDSLVEFLQDIRLDPVRVKSVQFRFLQENKSSEEVLSQAPVFGMHTYSTPSPINQEIGRGNFIFDSNWALVNRQNGLFGLMVYLSLFIFPILHWCFTTRKGVTHEDRAFLAASVAVFTVVCLHNIMNTFDNPLYYLLLGAFNNFYVYKGKEIVA